MACCLSQAPKIGIQQIILKDQIGFFFFLSVAVLIPYELLDLGFSLWHRDLYQTAKPRLLEPTETRIKCTDSWQINHHTCVSSISYFTVSELSQAHGLMQPSVPQQSRELHIYWMQTSQAFGHLLPIPKHGSAYVQQVLLIKLASLLFLSLSLSLSFITTKCEIISLLRIT